MSRKKNNLVELFIPRGIPQILLKKQSSDLDQFEWDYKYQLLIVIRIIKIGIPSEKLYGIGNTTYVDDKIVK